MKGFLTFIVMILICSWVTRNIFIGIGLTVAYMIFSVVKDKSKKEN